MVLRHKKPRKKTLNRVGIVKNESSTINLGLYSVTNNELICHTTNDQGISEIQIKSKSVFWGLGKMVIRKNSINKNIKEQLDKFVLDVAGK